MIQESHNVLYDQTQKSYSVVSTYPIGDTAQPYSVWEGSVQRCKYKEMPIQGDEAIFEASYHWRTLPIQSNGQDSRAWLVFSCQASCTGSRLEGLFCRVGTNYQLSGPY